MEIAFGTFNVYPRFVPFMFLLEEDLERGIEKVYLETSNNALRAHLETIDLDFDDYFENKIERFLIHEAIHISLFKITNSFICDSFDRIDKEDEISGYGISEFEVKGEENG